MKKGSITVFLALVLVLVLSFLFSLLEGARLQCLKSRAEILSELCMQSMFGNYHTGLWEDYHLLFLDGTWQEEKFSMEKFVQRSRTIAEENLTGPEAQPGRKNWDLIRLTVQNLTAEGYELATDGEGNVFQKQVSLQMQKEAVADVLEELLQIQEKGEEAKSGRQQKEGRWDQAWEAMEQAEELQKEQDSRQDTESAKPEPEEQTAAADTMQTEMENPMDYVKEIRASSMLTLVLEDPSGLSGKSLADREFIGKRTLQEGNWDKEAETGITDRLWLQYYIRKFFSNYTGASEAGPKERMLSYETEYLIGGKQSDSENLELVVYELLGIREAMNFITILQDTEKRNLAYSIAAAAVGFTGMAPLVSAVQIGVLLAWAFVESVLDVRALLEGRKVPFLKRTDQWSGDLECRNSIEGDLVAQEDPEGLDYAQYLQMLLFLLPEKTLNYRCMDLIERNEQVKMDTMIQSVKETFEFQAKPLFWNYNIFVRQGWDFFCIPVSADISYGGINL